MLPAAIFSCVLLLYLDFLLNSVVINREQTLEVLKEEYQCSPSTDLNRGIHPKKCARQASLL